MTKYLVLLLFSSCIVITSRGPDDGYALADKEQFSGFQDSLAQTDTFKIVEIKADEFKSVLPKSGNAVVILWASWCGHCLVELPSLIEASKSKAIYFVSSDYGLKRMNKEFKGYKKPIYVVSSQAYGPNETEKSRAFLHELSAKLDTAPVSFPKHLYFKQGEFAGVIEGQLSSQVLDSLLSK